MSTPSIDDDLLPMKDEAEFWLKRARMWRRTASVALTAAIFIFMACAALIVVVAILVGRLDSRC